MKRFGQFWKCIWKYSSHFHLSNDFSKLGRERRKKMLKKLQYSLSNKIRRKKDVNHYHPNISDLRLVDLYIIRINAFVELKVLTKKILDGKKENWWKYQVGIEGILKNTLSISKINCCVSDHLSLLKLHCSFGTICCRFYVSFSMLVRLYK